MGERREEFTQRVAQAAQQVVLARESLRIPWTGQEKLTVPNPQEEKSIDDFSYAKEAVENLMHAHHEGWLRIHLIDDDRFRIEFLPITDLPKLLAHIAEVRVFAKNIRQPVWGKILEEGDGLHPTYLQTTSFGVEGGLEGHESFADNTTIMRVYVDTERLLRVRDVYLDPESLNATPEEYGHAFMVFQGLPRETIDGAERVKLPKWRGSDLAASDDQSWPTEEQMVEEERRNAEQLRRFLKTMK